MNMIQLFQQRDPPHPKYGQLRQRSLAAKTMIWMVAVVMTLLESHATAFVSAKPAATSAFVPMFGKRRHVPNVELQRHSSKPATTTTFFSSSVQQQQQHEQQSDNNHSVLSTKSSSNRNSIRFLGRGAEAIVRPGCVLVAPLHEASHFLMRAALLVVDVGQQDESDEHSEYIIRAVILDHPTPFTMGEMVAHIFPEPTSDDNTTATHVLAEQLLFRGGDAGGDAVLLVHSVPDITTSTYAIGTSGLYQGGLQEALQRCQTEEDALQYKFFFNYCQFTETELEQMLAATDSQGDAWMSVEVSPSFVLDAGFDRGDAWAFLRNTIKQGGY